MNNFFKTEHPLENDRARLEPLEEKHYCSLLDVALHEELWLFSPHKINSAADFRKYFDQALLERAHECSYPYAIFDKQENKYAGSTRFGNISLPHKRMEIGWTWYHPDFQRTGLNKACKFLLLSYGFEKMELNRIELKTSLLNERSQNAMIRIGAVKEGIFRRHMVNEDGQLRDSVYFSFIREEWPFTKQQYFPAYIQ